MGLLFNIHVEYVFGGSIHFSWSFPEIRNYKAKLRGFVCECVGRPAANVTEDWTIEISKYRAPAANRTRANTN